MRYIPVHTGQICVVLSLSERAKVHPRAYGETLRGKESCFSSRGSSPCIRGQILPLLSSLSLPWVHPRAYGADFDFCWVKPRVQGSSPCIRGRSDMVNRFLVHQRFIPVHTGQILNFSKISETTKSLIPSQIPAVGSVCITFSECVFADNTFWSKKTDKNKICPSSAICSIWEFVSLHAKMR